MTTAPGGRGNEDLSSKRLSRLPPQQSSPVSPETETPPGLGLNLQQTSGMPAAKQRCSEEETLWFKRSRVFLSSTGGRTNVSGYQHHLIPTASSQHSLFFVFHSESLIINVQIQLPKVLVAHGQLVGLNPFHFPKLDPSACFNTLPFFFF